jgi:cysteinyl-tRNA synthetase
MIARWLGETIDIHHGGQDLIFPHHENEIAQSEAATGKTFCRHWVHHAFITAGNEKMSKSLGNIMPARDFIEIYGSEVLRFIFASFQYRSELPYTEEMLTQSLGELERVYLAKKWALEASAEGISPQGKGAPWAPLIGRSRDLVTKIDDELFADLNTPGALGHLFAYIREINRAEAFASGKPGVAAASSAERRQVAGELLTLLRQHLHPLLNVFGEEPGVMLKKIEEIRLARQKATVSEDEIRKLIEDRATARKNKDFKRADEIRLSLDARGIVLVDSPQGTTWKAKG